MQGRSERGEVNAEWLLGNRRRCSALSVDLRDQSRIVTQECCGHGSPRLRIKLRVRTTFVRLVPAVVSLVSSLATESPGGGSIRYVRFSDDHKEIAAPNLRFRESGRLLTYAVA